MELTSDSDYEQFTIMEQLFQRSTKPPPVTFQQGWSYIIQSSEEDGADDLKYKYKHCRRFLKDP